MSNEMMEGLEDQVCPHCLEVYAAANCTACLFCDAGELCPECLKRHDRDDHTAQEKADFKAEVLA